MYPIEELLAQESLSKPLSAVYFDLLSAVFPRMTRLWDKWKTEIPDLFRKDLEDCLNDSGKLFISSRDIQNKFIHRVYYTPQRLHHIYPQRSQDCTHCGGAFGTYMYINKISCAAKKYIRSLFCLYVTYILLCVSHILVAGAHLFLPHNTLIGCVTQTAQYFTLTYTYMYMFWTCPRVNSFWGEVISVSNWTFQSSQGCCY